MRKEASLLSRCGPPRSRRRHNAYYIRAGEPGGRGMYIDVYPGARSDSRPSYLQFHSYTNHRPPSRHKTFQSLPPFLPRSHHNIQWKKLHGSMLPRQRFYAAQCFARPETGFPSPPHCRSEDVGGGSGDSSRGSNSIAGGEKQSSGGTGFDNLSCCAHFDGQLAEERMPCRIVKEDLLCPELSVMG